MQAALIGKGPWLTGKKLGKCINTFDVVARVTNGRFGIDHGVKTDYMLTIQYEIYLLKKYIDILKLKCIWFYETKGRRLEPEWKKFDDEIRNTVDYTKEILHINDVIKHWLYMYEEIAEPLNRKNHPHVTYPSKGTAAALTIIELLKPGELFMLGMDNVAAGKRTYHCHDFQAEKIVIKKAAEKHDVHLVWHYDSK